MIGAVGILGALLSLCTGGLSLVAVAVASCSVVSEAFSIAGTAVEKSHPDLSETLGLAGFVIGIPGALWEGVNIMRTGCRILKGTGRTQETRVAVNNIHLTQTRPDTVPLTRQARRAIGHYEHQAYENGQRRLALPPRQSRGLRLYPNLDSHVRVVQSSPRIPLYSENLQEILPLPQRLSVELNRAYDLLNVSAETRRFSVLPHFSSGMEHGNFSDMPLPPPAYLTEDPFPVVTPSHPAQPVGYDEVNEDELLDFNYVSRL